MDKNKTCVFCYNGEQQQVNTAYLHRFTKHMTHDDPIMCHSPLPLDRIMSMYDPTAPPAELLARRLMLDIELGDEIQIEADMRDLFSVVRTPEDMQKIKDIPNMPKIHCQVKTQDEANFAKEYMHMLTMDSRMCVLRTLSEIFQRKRNVRGNICDVFIKGFRSKVDAPLIPLAIVRPEDMFDIRDFIGDEEYTKLKQLLDDLVGAVFPFSLNENLFIYNFAEAARKFSKNRMLDFAAVLPLSVLYEPLGGGNIVRAFNPSYKNGYAHYTKTGTVANTQTTVVINSVNYDTPRILYNGTQILAIADYIVCDISLLTQLS